MKTKYKLRLQEDKHRISRQIGILPSEEPRLGTGQKRDAITTPKQKSILQEDSGLG